MGIERPLLGRMKHLDTKHRVFTKDCRPNASSLHHISLHHINVNLCSMDPRSKGLQPQRCQMGLINALRQISKLTGLLHSQSVTSEHKNIRYNYPLRDSRTFNAKTSSKNQFLNRPLSSLLVPSLAKPLARPFPQLRMLVR
jgi:hypothetical protein